jgi:hypothetical protein
MGQNSESWIYFMLLFPGDVASLLITGGHGGTVPENLAAAVARFIVNVVANTFLIRLPIRFAYRGGKE